MIRRLLIALGFAPVCIADVIDRRRRQCELDLLDAEQELDGAVCRVAALRIRLERLTKA